MKDVQRVLVINNRHRYGGGADKMADETVRLLSNAGIDVEAITYDSRDILTTKGGKIRAAANSLYGRNALKKLEKKLVNFKPDLVHAHELYPMISPWVLKKCHNMNIPSIASLHDYRLTCPIATHFRRGVLCELCKNGSPWNAVLKNCRNNIGESIVYSAMICVARQFGLFERYCTRFIVPAAFSKQWFVSYGLDEHRISIVPNFSSMPVQKDVKKGGYVAYAGRYKAEKGVEMLFKAIRQAGLPLRLAGTFDGMTEEMWRGLDVKFEGNLPQKELMEFFRNARFLVVPSVCHETFGLVAVEAMACGTPVIASRMGGLADVVDHQVTGLLYDSDDCSALVEAMQTLWSDDEKCRIFGQNGLARVSELYTPERYVEKLLEVYRDVLLLPRAI